MLRTIVLLFTGCIVTFYELLSVIVRGRALLGPLENYIGVEIMQFCAVLTLV